MKKVLALVLTLAMLMSLAFVSTASAAEITDLRTYELTSREMETWNIHSSQLANDLNVLCNLIDGLLTNDAHGALVGNAAKDWYTEDGGKTWTFVLNDGMKWVDKDGNEKADVVAEDWITGLEWVLNFSKNGASNTSMPMEMIVGAAEYYDYTKYMAETYQRILDAGLTVPDELRKFIDPACFDTTLFKEMVGIAAPDDKTIVYTCTDELSYFPSVATYNCLYPLSAKLIEEVGVEGYKAITWENMWYSGAYTVTSYVHQNEKILTANPNYWNAANIKRFNTVTIKMVESQDVAYNLFQTGELDHVTLTQSTLSTIYGSESHEFHNNLAEARPTKYSYQIHLVYDKNNEDGTKDTNWNTAVANEAFRLSWYYGLDLTPYLARTNAINPLACQNFVYTGNAVAVNAEGVDYTQMVRDELGLQYSNETYARVDAEKAAAYKAQAMEELSAKGVTFPVEIDYYIQGNNQTAKDSADTLAQIFSDCLGDDYVKLNILTYVSSQTNEVRLPQLASIYINGWGADFADPINFLGQETYGEDNAYYSMNYSMINNATDEDLIATYTEFTQMVNDAKAITDDQTARYTAFAKAEAYFLNHALAIPCNYEVAWELTCINPYSKVYSAYGIQAYRYVNWETNDAIYTTDEVAALLEAYNSAE